MTRVRSLEGREAGILARLIQALTRLAFGRALNPTKVQAHATRGMLSSFLSNAILGSGRWVVGKDLVQLVRIRAAALNRLDLWMTADRLAPLRPEDLADMIGGAAPYVAKTASYPPMRAEYAPLYVVHRRNALLEIGHVA